MRMDNKETIGNIYKKNEWFFIVEVFNNPFNIRDKIIQLFKSFEYLQNSYLDE